MPHRRGGVAIVPRMGLDSVELVMEFEDVFELEIPNEDAEQLQTVGDVTDWVFRYLEQDQRPQSRDAVFATVCEITREQCGVPADQALTEDTAFLNDLGID